MASGAWPRARGKPSFSILRSKQDRSLHVLDPFPHLNICIVGVARLGDAVQADRSKNAGPFMVTVDVFCGTDAAFQGVNGALSTAAVGQLYRVDPERIGRYELPEIRVVTFSFPRPVPQGAFRTGTCTARNGRCCWRRPSSGTDRPPELERSSARRSTLLSIPVRSICAAAGCSGGLPLFRAYRMCAHACVLRAPITRARAGNTSTVGSAGGISRQRQAAFGCRFPQTHRNSDFPESIRIRELNPIYRTKRQNRPARYPAVSDRSLPGPGRRCGGLIGRCWQP